MKNLRETRGEIAMVCLEFAFVIACDKREAFAQGSTCDEAIQSFVRQDGLLRCARNDGWAV
jgi:hypothetical protein